MRDRLGRRGGGRRRRSRIGNVVFFAGAAVESLDLFNDCLGRCIVHDKILDCALSEQFELSDDDAIVSSDRCVTYFIIYSIGTW